MLKYELIANQIESYIETNKLQQGEKLPVLQDLIKTYEVSKSTIVKSLDLLEKKGVIFQVRGSGIFVRRHKRKGYISLFSNQGFKKDLDNFQITSKVLDLQIIKPTDSIMENLNIEDNTDVYYVKRIRYINDQTLCLEESYYNKDIVTYLNKEIVTESIFQYIEQALGLKIGFSDVFIRAEKLKELEADYLGLHKGDPTLYMEQVFHLSNGQPFDYSKLTYNYIQSQFFHQTSSLI